MLVSRQIKPSSSLNGIAGQARNDGFILIAVSFIYLLALTTVLVSTKKATLNRVAFFKNYIN